MRLEITQVFRLQCHTCRPPKPKYFVVALVDPFRCFLINSEATDFQKSRPDLMRTLAPIKKKFNHSFLYQDSLISCNALLMEYSAEEVLAEYKKNSDIYKGKIDRSARQAVRAALMDNRFLSAKYLPPLLAVW